MESKLGKIVIFGGGGFAREVHQLIEDINAVAPTWHCMGFLDGDASRHGTLIHDLPVLGGVEWLESDACEGTSLVVAVGNPALRCKIVGALEREGRAHFATLVHPRAWVGNRVTIGPGSIVCAGVLITTDVALGRHVIVNIGSTIGHDAMVGDFVTIAPTVNVSGAVTLGEGADLGTGSTLIQGRQVGAWSIVGAGSVVVKDIEANVTAVGSPTRVIKSRNAGWQLE